MKDVEDKTYKTKVLAEAKTIAGRAREKCAEVLEILER
jgi:hypothetical protein